MKFTFGDKVRMSDAMGRETYPHPAGIGFVSDVAKGEFTGCYMVTTESGRYPVFGSDLSPCTSFGVSEGELEGWEFLLKIVTNNCGKMAIVAGGNEAVVLVGPTKDPEVIINWVADYMRDDS